MQVKCHSQLAEMSYNTLPSFLTTHVNDDAKSVQPSVSWLMTGAQLMILRQV